MTCTASQSQLVYWNEDQPWQHSLYRPGNPDIASMPGDCQHATEVVLIRGVLPLLLCERCLWFISLPKKGERQITYMGWSRVGQFYAPVTPETVKVDGEEIAKPVDKGRAWLIYLWT